MCRSAGVVAPSGELCLIGVYHHTMILRIPLPQYWEKCKCGGICEKTIVNREYEVPVSKKASKYWTVTDRFGRQIAVRAGGRGIVMMYDDGANIESVAFFFFNVGHKLL